MILSLRGPFWILIVVTNGLDKGVHYINLHNFSKDVDITMMILFGGKERTKKEWEQLFLKASLELLHIQTTPTMLSIIELKKQI